MVVKIAPRIKRAALIYNPNTNPASYLRSAQAVAPGLGVAMHEILLRDAPTLQDALAAFATEPDGALLVQPDVTTTANRALIMADAARHRLPAIYPYSYYPAEGGLMSYGIDLSDGFRRAASGVRSSDRTGVTDHTDAALGIVTEHEIEDVLRVWLGCRANHLGVPRRELIRGEAVEVGDLSVVEPAGRDRVDDRLAVALSSLDRDGLGHGGVV